MSKKEKDPEKKTGPEEGYIDICGGLKNPLPKKIETPEEKQDSKKKKN